MDLNKNAQIVIIAGSKSDSKIIQKATNILDEFQIQYSLHMISAHRNPDKLDALIKEINDSKGVKVIIAIAGMSAALPGVIASKTLKPVIGVPVSSTLMGMDALLSMAQMPSGIPVATVGIDNGKNAAFLALSILGLENKSLENKLREYRQNQ